MTGNALKEILLNKTFEPTRFIFSDGSVRDVRHREFMTLSYVQPAG